MAEFQPILISNENMVLDYKEGQFITATKPFKDAEGMSYEVGVYVDLGNERRMLTTQGTKGDKVDRGLQGVQGVKCDTGMQGIQGIRGITGTAGPQGVQGIQGVRGLQGIQGPQGKPGNIRHWYNSVAEMENDFSNPDLAFYDLAAINSNDTAEDGLMYYKGKTEWVYVTTFRGVEGPQGAQGKQGIQGVQGPMGSGFKWLGLWEDFNAGFEFAENNVVLINGGGRCL